MKYIYKEDYHTQTAVSTKANFWTAYITAKANAHGPMVLLKKATGKTENWRASQYPKSVNCAEQGHELAKQALKEIKEKGYLLMSFGYKVEI